LSTALDPSALPPPSLRPMADPSNASNTAKPSDPPETFEAALAELERIVATMEGGQLPLAEALAAYQRGAELLQYCQTVLKDAEQQVQVLERGVLKAFAPAEPDTGVSGAEGSRPVEGDVS
jgi:exodeoxyribonuclease VII small subunit